MAALNASSGSAQDVETRADRVALRGADCLATCCWIVGNHAFGLRIGDAHAGLVAELIAVRRASFGSSIGVLMKSWLSGGIVAAAFAFASAIQAAPERGSDSASGSLTSEPFYEGKEGSWILMHKPSNDGYSCSVNFVTPTNNFAIVGPVDADMARNGRGMIWFTGKSIPATGQASSVRIALSGNNPYPSVPAQHMSLPGQGGALIVAVDLRLTLKDKEHDNIIGVQLQGREVFRSSIVHLQEAYRNLERCMNKSQDPVKKYSEKIPMTRQEQLTMTDDELATYYDIAPDDPERAIKVSNRRQMNVLMVNQTKRLMEFRMPSISFSDGPARDPQTQEQRMCGHNNGQVGYLAPC